MRRRDFVLGALGAGLISGNGFNPLLGVAAATAAPRLPAIPFGAAVRDWALTNDFDYRTALVTHCKLVVGEGGLKWIDLRPTPEQYVFEQPDRLIAFAAKNGMRMRGHTLAWYGAMPDWTKSITGAKQAENELITHITTVMGRYKGRIASWDVVNEAIAEDPGGSVTIRDSIWQAALGKGYIDLSLRTAAAVDPAAQLVINEYDIEGANEQSRQRRAALLAVLRGLKDRDVPLHAVGLQGHLRGDVEIDKDGLSKFIEALKEMQLDVLITELDVIDDKLPASSYDRDEMVAARAKEFIMAIADVQRPNAILTWGITDRYTWVPTWFKRRDGEPNRPLPLDSNYRPKKLMQTIQDVTRAVG